MMHKYSATALRAALTASFLLVATIAHGAGDGYKDALAAYKKKDYPTALRLFSELAHAGDARAQYNLGIMYLNGEGVPQSNPEALKWLRTSTLHKKAFEAYNRGDYATALQLYRPLANKGEVTAEYIIGLMYANGQGVPQSYAEAMKWHHKVAEQGEALGQFSVGLLYFKGLGVPRNAAEAAKWFHKAADQGDAKAQYNLGSMYAKGEGVTKNDVSAHVFLTLAAGQGIEAAKQARDKLAQSMTPAQVAEAEKQERNWKPQREN